MGARLARGVLGVIGDVNYIEHGGMVVYEDGSVAYVEPGESEDDPVYIYRFEAARVSEPSREWYGDKLTAVASMVDANVLDLAAALNSDDPRTRASAYYDLVQYYGPANFDESPMVMSMSEAEKWAKPIDRAIAKRRK